LCVPCREGGADVNESAAAVAVREAGTGETRLPSPGRTRGAAVADLLLERKMGTSRMDEFKQGRGRGPPEDFFVVVAGRVGIRVSPETAAEVMRKIARRFPPRWLAFVDLDGSRVRVRTSLVGQILESTALQRQRWREFDRARTAEETADSDEEEKYG